MAFPSIAAPSGTHGSSTPVLDGDEVSGTFHHTAFVLDGGMLFGLHTL